MEDADTLWGRPQAEGGRDGERNGAGGRVSLRFGERGWSFWQDEVVGEGGAVLADMGVFQEKEEVVDFVGWPPHGSASLERTTYKFPLMLGRARERRG